MIQGIAPRVALALASALIVAVATPGFTTTAEAQEESATIEEIRWALPSIPETLFVPHSWQTYTGAIMSLAQEGMLAFDDDLSLIAGVADSWEQVDPVTVKYHLREGVTFHDGSPLTPEDVVASMQMHMRPETGSQLAAFYSSVASIEATGEREVTVKLDSPNTQYQYTPAHMSGFIFQKSQLEAHEQDIGTPDVLPIGTGPYKLVEFSPADRVVLEAYDGYWGPKPTVRRITILAIPDRQTRLLAMRSGDIDGTFDLSISDIEQWQALDGVDVLTTPSLGVYLLTLDQETPPFDDIHVRRAIAHAVDRAGLVQALLKGNGEPAVALNPPQMWAGVLAEEEVEAFYDMLPDHSFDLEKAKAELAQSAHPDGFSATVQVSNADPYMVNILLSVAENLRQIGVTVDVREVDHNQWLTEFFRHEDLGMQMMSYFPDYADPANYPYLFFASENAVKDGMNGSNYRNPKVDELLAVALEESDPAKRAEALKDLFRIVKEEVAVVPIFWPYSAMAISSDYQFTGYNAFWYNVPWAIRGFSAK